MRKLDGHGFSAIEALLIFVVIVIIGGTGWLVYNANRKTSETLDATTKSSTSSLKFSNRKTATNNQPLAANQQMARGTDNKTLDLKELRIKFKLPADVQDAVYVMSRDGTTAYLSSQNLMNQQKLYSSGDASDCDAQSDPARGPLGYIVKSSQGVGGKSSFNRAQAACSGSNSIDQLQLSQEKALEDAFNSTLTAY